MSSVIDELRPWLQDPRYALQKFGTVLTPDELHAPFDPFQITKNMQATILSYVADPPRDEIGSTKWLVVLKGRQGGASTTAALAFYCKAQYTPGWNHVTMADHDQRAQDLFDRVRLNHENWPDELREELINQLQTRHYEWTHGGKIRVLSGKSRGGGIGRSFSSLHASELPLWDDAASQFSMLFPAMLNRPNSQMLLESTPFALSEPSAPWFQGICSQARAGKGRFIYAFFPFWDTTINSRPWPKDSPMTNEEIDLMNRYHDLGLREEHLAFRRYVMDTDEELLKNPDLFGTWYPFDDITCWIASSLQVIKPHHLARHLTGLVPFNALRGWMQYENVREDAIYVIGADPAGYGAGDHASFHVLEVWNGEWRQVFTCAGQMDPPEFEDLLMEVGYKFNKALIGFERNGVGHSTATSLIRARYPKVYRDEGLRPGLHKSDESVWLSDLISALKNTLVLRDEDTVRQLQGYQRDATVRQSDKSLLLRPEGQRGRRPKHHWDKVSALMVAIQMAKVVPQHSKPHQVEAPAVVPFTGYTVRDIDKMAQMQRAQKLARSRPRSARKANYQRLKR